jgi:hypothetical protein
MVQAVINIQEETNRILNIVKAKYGLKDKSQAIELVVSEYEENFLEPELRPEYVEKIKDLEKRGKFKRYKSLRSLRKEIEHA